MAEKFPVQKQVNNEQGGKYQARVVMHGDPLVSWNAKIRYPAAPPSATFRQYEIQHKAGNQRRDERDQAADVHKCINGDAFQGNTSYQVYGNCRK